MKRIQLISILLLIPFFTVLSQVDDQGAINDTIDLNEVVVTGTTVKVNRSNVPMAVTVVSASQIRESTETALLPALNGNVPGLFITERGIMGFGVSTGAAGQISLRGIGGSPTTGVLVLIDGHPQFMGIFGHPLPDSYVTSDVEKVEVIRGPASILYGSNAMGGVINIITRKQTEEGLYANAHLMYGSCNTQKYMASAGYKKNKLSVFSSVNHDQTDGHRANSDFSLTNGYLKLKYELSGNVSLNTDFSIAHFKAQDPGPDTLDALPGYRLDVTRGYWSFTLDNNFEKYSGAVKLFYNFGEHKITDGFHSNDANYGLNIYESVKLFKNNSLTIGADYLVYGGDAENETYGSSIIDTTVYDAGVYGFMQQTLFNNLVLNAGLRIQNHKVYGTQWIPAGGFAWKIFENTTWKASVSKGFRSPTIRELFIWNHNVNLKPESVFSYETGIIQGFKQKKMKLELTAFMVKGDNMIIAVPLKGLQNAGKVDNKGVEFAANLNPTEKLSCSVTYSYTHMTTPVYATPRHNIYTSCTYCLNKLRITASVQHIDHLDNDSSVSSESFETYTLLNSKVSFKLKEWCEFFVSSENILNQKYQTNLYYSMPGITLFGGAKMKF